MMRAVVRFGLLRDCVGPGMCSAGSAVVGPVARLISGDVEVCGKTLVLISLEVGTTPNMMVPVSCRLIKAEPSTRQYVSVSSFSTRLHWGQRLMKGWCWWTRVHSSAIWPIFKNVKTRDTGSAFYLLVLAAPGNQELLAVGRNVLFAKNGSL